MIDIVEQGKRVKKDELVWARIIELCRVFFLYLSTFHRSTARMLHNKTEEITVSYFPPFTAFLPLVVRYCRRMWVWGANKGSKYAIMVYRISCVWNTFLVKKTCLLAPPSRLLTVPLLPIFCWRRLRYELERNVSCVRVLCVQGRKGKVFFRSWHRCTFHPLNT